MTNIEKIELSNKCWIEVWKYSEFPNQCSINYIERSHSYYGSDIETEVEIDKEMAQRIVDFLTEHVLKEEQCQN